jgi:hypothetical protein
MMKAASVERKLEEWETVAYTQAWGNEWIETIGEGFKFYARDCAALKSRMSISGFMKWLNPKAPRREPLEVKF